MSLGTHCRSGRCVFLPGVYPLLRATGLRNDLNIKKSDFMTLHVRLGNAVISCSTLHIRLVFPLSVNEMAFVINGSSLIELNSSYVKSKTHYVA